MTVHLLISPPATGKTRFCLDLAKSAAQNTLFSEIWFLVPDQIQADAVRARFFATGQSISARVATFYELYGEILERTGCTRPVAGHNMLQRMLAEIIRTLCASGKIPHYTPICSLPGFINEIHERITEFKRSLVEPDRLLDVAQTQKDAGLMDLAQIYAAYQRRLKDLGWTDLEGLSWSALEVLSSDEKVLTDLSLLVVDGFDNFNPAQFRVLHKAAGRAAETWITLPGTPEMKRMAHQRFALAAKKLSEGQPLDVQTLAASPYLPPTLCRVEAAIFETPLLPVSEGKDLLRLEARSPVEEAREALRWLKARIVRDGLAPSACAIAVPELETYRAPLEDAADEFGLSLKFIQGPLVSTTPLGAALMDLLRLASNDYPLRPLLDTVRSPYFDLTSLGLQHTDAKLLEIASRYGQVVQGIAQWEVTLKALSAQSSPQTDLEDLAEEGMSPPRLPTGTQAVRLLSGLRALSERLSPPLEAISYSEWALWLQELFEHLGLSACLAAAGETELNDTLDHLLLSVARSEALSGPCLADYAGFLKEWERLMRSIPVQADQPHGIQQGIRVLGMMEARGIRVDALAVLGLAEGSFPVVEHADPFLSEEVRSQLGMDPRLGQEQAGLFYQVITRADRTLLLTRPYLAKDGESWEPSPAWNAVQELLQGPPLRIRADAAQGLCEAASPNELLFWAARCRSQTGMDFPATFAQRFNLRWQHITETQSILAARLQKESKGVYDGDLSVLAQSLGVRYGEKAGWSASRLEAYASCPFSFLTSSALGLEVIEPPQIGYQANQLGTILHEVLEKVYPEVSDPANTADVLAHLPDVARRVFASAPQKFQFRPSLLWEVEQAELLLVLVAAIQGIADQDQDRGWRPLAFEAKFGLAGQPPLILHTPSGDILLHGLVDRVDIDPDGKLRVIDYKSGGAHLTPQDLIEGRRLQLPIYALAASQALGLGEPAEGFYWKLFQRGVSSLRLSQFECDAETGPQAAFALASRYIETIVTQIRLGLFQPLPPPGGCPGYCAAASWCWHYHAGRY